MKKFFITAAALLAFVVASAQLVNVGGVQKLDVTTGDKVVISPDGSYVVTVKANSLEKVNVADGSTKTIAKGAGLYNVAISNDGKNVVYTRPSFDKKHLRHISLESVDSEGANSKVLVKATRKLNHGVSFADGSVSMVNNGKQQTKALNGGKAVKSAIASINYGHLDITVDGKTTTIDPQGRGSYIWASISPNGQRVCYWLVGRGCFTCNLDGSDVKSHGPLRAAVWAGNDMIVGMDEIEGNAQQVLASSIVALDVNTNEVQKLTDDSVIAQFPSVNADGTRVAFTTPAGEVYIINLVK